MAGKGKNNPGSLVIYSRVEEATRNETKRIFINTLEKVHTVRVAAKIVGINPVTLYEWKKKDPQFSEDWDNAVLYSSDALESALYLKLAQAYNDQRRRISMPEARLTEFMLSGMKPEKYRQAHSLEVTQLNFTIDWSKVPDEMLAKYNAGLFTLQDVYDWSIQSQEQKGATPSEVGRAEGSCEEGTAETPTIEDS